MTMTTRRYGPSRRDYRLGLVLALAVVLVYLVHRRQVRSDLGEGVWQQAPRDTEGPAV